MTLTETRPTGVHVTEGGVTVELWAFGQVIARADRLTSLTDVVIHRAVAQWRMAAGQPPEARDIACVLASIPAYAHFANAKYVSVRPGVYDIYEALTGWYPLGTRAVRMERFAMPGGITFRCGLSAESGTVYYEADA